MSFLLAFHPIPTHSLQVANLLVSSLLFPMGLFGFFFLCKNRKILQYFTISPCFTQKNGIIFVSSCIYLFHFSVYPRIAPYPFIDLPCSFLQLHSTPLCQCTRVYSTDCWCIVTEAVSKILSLHTVLWYVALYIYILLCGCRCSFS